jgi:hypothetical protein
MDSNTSDVAAGLLFGGARHMPDRGGFAYLLDHAESEIADLAAVRETFKCVVRGIVIRPREVRGGHMIQQCVFCHVVYDVLDTY